MMDTALGTSPTTVALIVANTSLPELHKLAGQMPVWINNSLIDSSILADLRRAAAFGITTYFDQPGDDRRKSISRALFSLDEHHNEVSQAPPYSELQVFGTSLGELDEAVLRELGFDKFSHSNNGFTAFKTSK